MVKSDLSISGLTFPTIMLSNTSSSSADMTTNPFMALRMSCRLDRTTSISRLKRINSCTRTVFMDSSYLTGYLVCRWMDIIHVHEEASLFHTCWYLLLVTSGEICTQSAYLFIQYYSIRSPLTKNWNHLKCSFNHCKIFNEIFVLGQGGAVPGLNRQWS